MDIHLHLMASPGTGLGRHPPRVVLPPRPGPVPEVPGPGPARRRAAGGQLDGRRGPAARASPARPARPPSRRGWPPSATAWRSWPRTSRTTPRTRPGSSWWPGPGCPAPTGPRQDEHRLLPAGRPPGQPARHSGPVRGAQHQPDQARVAPDQAGAGRLLLRHRPRRATSGDEVVADCLRDLHAGLAGVKFLGSYPAGRGARARAAAPGRRGVAGGGRLAARAPRRYRLRRESGPGPRTGMTGTAAGTLPRGGHVTLQTIDVDQHLFESRTTWSEYIDPAQRADALSIADDDAGWPWLTWRGDRLTPLEVPIPERSTLIGDDRLRRLRGERAPASFDELVPDSYRLAGARLAVARRVRSRCRGAVPELRTAVGAAAGVGPRARSGPTPAPTTASWPTSAATAKAGSSGWPTSCCTIRRGRSRRSDGCVREGCAWP